MREHEDGYIVLERGIEAFSFDQLQCEAMLFTKRFGNVEVGWEVTALTDDFLLHSFPTRRSSDHRKSVV